MPSSTDKEKQMVNGKYSITLKTPLGARKGELELTGTEEKLHAVLNVMKKVNEFEGSAEGDTFTLAGVLKTGMGSFDCTFTGTVDGDVLTGTGKSKKGEIALTGTRTA